MNKITRGIVASVCLLGASYASAQTTFFVEGLGRAQIQNDELIGDVLQTDTAGAQQLEKKQTGGYTLLDLGINIEKKDKFFLNTIFRGRDPFGLFWGDGTTFEFRKITMGGIIGKGIKYELGDIYLEMSPYTVFNPEVDYTKYESDIFGARREIVEYENFIQDNARFLQGFKASGTLLFTKGIEKLHLKGFATRTSQITQFGAPDEILAGASIHADQGRFGQYGVNFVSLFDLPVATNTERIRSSVLSVELNPEVSINKDVIIGIDAELGGSNFATEDIVSVDRNIEFSGMFVDANLMADLKKIKTKVAAGYRSVDTEFRSPGAQTRRINTAQTPSVFSNGSVLPDSSLAPRTVNYYDRFTQEDIYTGGIQNSLAEFDPTFDNVTPFGDATPNRTGIQFKASRGTTSDAFSLDVEVLALSEVDGDNTLVGSTLTQQEPREFLEINSGLNINVGKLLGSKRRIAVGGGFQMDQTTRGGSESVDLTSTVIDGSLAVEVLEKFDLLAGYKVFTAEGNEFTRQIADNNFTYNSIENVNYDRTQTMLSFGARFRFTEKAALNLNYNIVTLDDDQTVEDDNYGINQLFLNYTMTF